VRPVPALSLLLGFASDFQVAIQCDQGWIPLEGCGQRGGIETFSDAITSAGDRAASLAFATVVVERGKPSKSRHFSRERVPSSGMRMRRAIAVRSPMPGTLSGDRTDWQIGEISASISASGSEV
jgi:hypothetical protein